VQEKKESPRSSSYTVIHRAGIELDERKHSPSVSVNYDELKNDEGKINPTTPKDDEYTVIDEFLQGKKNRRLSPLTL
jgi:hypothetical protein